MAKKDGEIKEEISEEVTLTEEEEKALIEAFKELGVKPKATTPKELKEWMATYVSVVPQTKEVK